MRGAKKWVAAFILLAMVACSSTETADWQRVQGGPETNCALGDPFYFYGKITSQQKLFVFLGGGGACWDAATCDVERSPRFRSTPDTIRRYNSGLLDDTHDLNPFKEYSFLIIPYCTGDLDLGSRVVEYERADAEGLAPSFTIHHVGSRNVRAALNWITERVPSPEIIVVGGQSAGAPSSPYVATVLARQYPSSRVVQIGDAAGALIAPQWTWRTLRHWGADSLLLADGLIQERDAEQMTLEDLYIGAIGVAPNLQISQVNSVDDSTQLSYLNLVGLGNVPVSQVLATSMSRIESAVPEFRFFVVEGYKHVFLSSPDIYETTSEGVRLLDWIADLVAGKEVASVGRSLLAPDTIGVP